MLSLRYGKSTLCFARTCGRRNVPLEIRRTMCGLIAAIDNVWFTRRSGQGPCSDVPILSDEQALKRATFLLNHRGPDGSQVQMGSFVGGEHRSHTRRWSMGHTRLAIVDPTNALADMPFRHTFVSKNGEKKSIHLVANGEIYNHEQVYERIEADGGSRITKLSNSDCEVIAHAYAKYGREMVSMLDGMFAFVLFEENHATGEIQAYAARDPVGIKPIYMGSVTKSGDSSAYVFASEMKALVGHVEPSSVIAIPPGHSWSPDTGVVRYHEPDWMRLGDKFKPWEGTQKVTNDEVCDAFARAVRKRNMADVEYGFFLSGGIDSCVVAHNLLPMWRKSNDRPIKAYTVGMEGSPDVTAAQSMVSALGGSKHVEHHVQVFTPDEVFDLIPKIVYHMETYEAELIRSAIPNWFLAERAARDVKMVQTGEGADELFAGYLYFQDAPDPSALQRELRRIYSMLGNVNLHRTDRMTMAHGLEARVPFLDTDFTSLCMSVDPQRKMINAEAVRTNSRGREKTYLRELFEGPNANGDSIPCPVLWRAKAMQCEGVGEDWVAILQARLSSEVTDAELANARRTFPLNTPQTKEEFYYRRIFDEQFRGMDGAVKLWEGGCRALGAEWRSDTYTRTGLNDVSVLRHSLQGQRRQERSSRQLRCFSSFAILDGAARGESESVEHLVQPSSREAFDRAKSAGFDDFEALLTCGGDDRSIVLDVETGANKYHTTPRPIDDSHVFRGSCTGNPPTVRGYNAARKLFKRLVTTSKCDVDTEVRGVFDDQRDRLSRNLNLPKDAEIVLCPSGSDAEYVPIAIAQALGGNDVNIGTWVTQLKEIGAGSPLASNGEYFSSHAPLVGRLGDDTASYLSGCEHRIDLVTSEAREREDGTALDIRGTMIAFRDRKRSEGSFPIIHGVFGGKTGLRDVHMPPSFDGGRSGLGVVDACQGRFYDDELRGWIEQDSLVLVTGSKFYQGPPFCGAVIVPPTIARHLRESGATPRPKMLSVGGLGGFLTEKELPDCMREWRHVMSEREDRVVNIGLALRWEAALAGMDAIQDVPNDRARSAIREWSGAVGDMISKEKGALRARFVERSIVSASIQKDATDRCLNMSESRELYRWMSMDISGCLDSVSAEDRNALAKSIYIGQPVDVCEHFAIVRLALGVESLLSFLSDPEATLEEDRCAVRKLALIGKNFGVLKSSGI